MKMRHALSNAILGILFGGIDSHTVGTLFWLCSLIHFQRGNLVPKLWQRAGLANEIKDEQYEKIMVTGKMIPKLIFQCYFLNLFISDEYFQAILGHFIDPTPKKRKPFGVSIDSVKVQVCQSTWK